MADTSALISVGKWVGNLLFGFILKRLEERKASKITLCVISSGSGKTKLLETFRTEFGSTQTDLYLLDIEQAVMSDVKNAAIVAQLNELKMKDVLLYEAQLFSLCKSHLNNVVQHLKSTGVKKEIVVLCSSKNLKKYLGVKSGHYFGPTKRLFENLKPKYPFVEYMQYTRNLLENKDVHIYNSFDELYQEFLTVLKVEREL